MRKLLCIIHDKRGSMPILAIGMCIVLLCIMMLVMEFGGTFESYDRAVDTLQRCCNNAVEKNVLDEYRQDRILKMDCDGAAADFYSFMASDLDPKYTVTVTDISTTDTPPTMTVTGSISFDTLFSQYGFGRITFTFKVRATNYDLVV